MPVCPVVDGKARVGAHGRSSSEGEGGGEERKGRRMVYKNGVTCYDDAGLRGDLWHVLSDCGRLEVKEASTRAPRYLIRPEIAFENMSTNDMSGAQETCK